MGELIPLVRPPEAVPAAPPGASSDELYTPRSIRSRLPRVCLDPCANPRRSVAADRHIVGLEGGDGLVEPWAPARSAFVNPPYTGRQKRAWFERIGHALDVEGLEYVLALVPATPGSGYWRTHVWPRHASVCWLGRVTFEYGEGRPMPAGSRFECALLVLPSQATSLSERSLAELRGLAEAFADRPWSTCHHTPARRHQLRLFP